jgi:DNA-binding protein H-NS
MTDYQHLSESELRAVIEHAGVALKNKQANKKKEIIAQIKDLAASIDMQVELYEEGNKTLRTTSKVPVKYRHPSDSGKTWTGRGMTPKWLRDLVDQGRSLDDFKV